MDVDVHAASDGPDVLGLLQGLQAGGESAGDRWRADEMTRRLSSADAWAIDLVKQSTTKTYKFLPDHLTKGAGGVSGGVSEGVANAMRNLHKVTILRFRARNAHISAGRVARYSVSPRAKPRRCGGHREQQRRAAQPRPDRHSGGNAR